MLYLQLAAVLFVLVCGVVATALEIRSRRKSADMLRCLAKIYKIQSQLDAKRRAIEQQQAAGG